MKHVVVSILALTAALVLSSCGKPEVTVPFSIPNHESNELAVSPPGADSISGKDNFVRFEGLSSAETGKALSYTATENRTLQVVVNSTSGSADCDIFNMETFGEWTPDGGSPTRVRTSDGFFGGDNYNVEKGKKYTFHFYVKPAKGCQWASFQFKVITP